MKKVPKISIIIPTFNNRKYIESAILSALNQTYPNIEIIVVDDNSKDDTESIVNKLKNSNMLYIRLEENIGASSAKNIGIKNSTGDYIAFLDSDDMYSRDKIEEQINIFKNSISAERNLGYVYCGVKLITEDSNILTISHPTGKAWDGIINDDFIGATPLIKRECFENAGMFDSNLKYFEDMDLYLRIRLSGYTYGYSEKAMYYYRQHHTNISKNRRLMAENIDTYFSKYLSMPEFKNNKKILSQYYMKKGITLSLINPLSAINYILLSFILNPLVVFKRFRKLLLNYLKLVNKYIKPLKLPYINI